MALWPGAGTGTGRLLLLRASPLRRDGTLAGEAFGRRLLHGTLEGEIRVRRLGPVAVGVALFADGARAWNRPGDTGPAHAFAVGTAERFRPGGSSSVRLDVAHRPGGRGVVVSAGWLTAWPH
jgi:hypothetical protein